MFPFSTSQPFVEHAESLLSLSHRLLGSRLTEAVVKATFFAHFCAGEDVREVRRTAQRLQVRGWGAVAGRVGTGASPHETYDRGEASVGILPHAIPHAW